MNWYKKAKIIDLKNDIASCSPTICTICRRWKTKDEFNTIIWKHYNEMTTEEKAYVNQCKSHSNIGLAKINMEICNECFRKPKRKLI